MGWEMVGGILASVLAVAGLAFGLRLYLLRLVDRRISCYQNDLLQKHCEEVEHMYRQTRGWRHDYHNHIQTLKAHLALGNLQELDAYLNELDQDLTTVDTVIKTGNIMVDAVLNSKISLAKARGIHVEAKAAVPAKLAISEIDLSLVVGNLMDNAMEACMEIEDAGKRFIRVYIDMLKGQLYLYVMNAVEGRPERGVRGYLSRKGGSQHGFGLMRVDRVVARYQGYLDRQDEEGVFVTEVMLPVRLPG